MGKKVYVGNISPEAGRGGFVVLLLLLVIVVIGALIWLDPAALFSRPDPDLPWNEEFRIVKQGEQVQKPTEEQPSITGFIRYAADAKKEGEARGKISLMIQPDGRVKGGWTAEYNPNPKINLLVMSGGFDGNIDPSKVYTDEDGEDRSKLYFITKGGLIILETRKESGTVRSVKARIYVTGWIGPEYNATGEITITSDKRTYQTFYWEAGPAH